MARAKLYGIRFSNAPFALFAVIVVVGVLIFTSGVFEDSPPIVQPSETKHSTVGAPRERREGSNESPLMKLPAHMDPVADVRKFAINILEGKEYPHHPVMLQVPVRGYPMEKNYIVEVNGLRYPAKFDCEMFNKNQPWGNHKYFWMAPSRWTACYTHEAIIRSGFVLEVPELPLIDDEYAEQTAIYQSVLRARTDQPFVIGEIGARWGTWGARGVAFLKALRPDADYSVYFVEKDQATCDGLEEVMQKNSIRYTLLCKSANAAHFRQWAETVDHIDVIDFDVQGAEVELIEATIDVLNCKAYRLIIGTHGQLGEPSVHERVKKLLLQHGWLIISDMPRQHDDQCMEKHLRGGYGHDPERFDWEKVLEKGCYWQSPLGKICQGDGELIVDNPKFVNSAKVFSMADTELKIDDLRETTAVPKTCPAR